MRKKATLIIMIVLIILISLVSIGAYFYLTPHNKTIELNGYSLNVPDSKSAVNNDTDNFKTYLDPTNNISIKSYAINNVNDHNLKGADEIGYLIPTMGDNFTENGVQLYNNSSIYSYLNYSSYQILLIKSPNSTLLSQIVQSMNKTEINPQGDLSVFSNFTTLTSNPFGTQEKVTSTVTRKTTTKSKSSNSKKSSDDGVYDVVIPGSGGKTTKAKHLGLTPYGNRYQEVGTGKIIYS